MNTSSKNLLRPKLGLPTKLQIGCNKFLQFMSWHLDDSSPQYQKKNRTEKNKINLTIINFSFFTPNFCFIARDIAIFFWNEKLFAFTQLCCYVSLWLFEKYNEKIFFFWLILCDCWSKIPDMIEKNWRQ